MRNRVRRSARDLFLATTSLAAALGLAEVAHADTPVIGPISVYGTIDVGLGYQSAGVPSNGATGIEYQAFTTTRNLGGSQALVTENALEYSKLGIKLNEPITKDLALIGQAEAWINPLSGQLMDSCKSIAQNSGVPDAKQTATFDSAGCGQAFSRGLFAGIASKTYGTVTFGRQNTPFMAVLAAFDPQANAPAFSFIGYSGTLGGAGSTGASRWDNAVKYAYAHGPFHLTAEFAAKSPDNGLPGSSWGITGGLTYAGFSLDLGYEKENAVVSLRSSDDNAANALTNTQGAANGGDIWNSVNQNGLSAYLSKNTAFLAVGKYEMAFSDKSKLTLFAGYEHFEKAYAANPYAGIAGYAQGGYPVAIDLEVTTTPKYDFEWFGARYATARGLTISAAYYNAHVGDWAVGLTTNGAGPLAGVPAGLSLGCGAAGLLCAGSFHEASLIVDKAIHKHVDLYVGVNWSEVTNGLAYGFPGNQGGAGVGTTGSQTQTGLYTGVRIKF